MAENITSNFTGQPADLLLVLMSVGNQAVEKGAFHLAEGIGKDLYLPRLRAGANMIQARQVTPTTSGDNITYNEKTISPNEMMVYEELNPNAWWNVWEQFFPDGLAVDTVHDPMVISTILQEILKSVGTEISELMFQGDTSLTAGDPNSWIDGIVKQATDSAETVKVAPAGNITAGNIISIMSGLDAAIPDTIYDDPMVTYIMSTADFRKLQDAYRSETFKGMNIMDPADPRFAGRGIKHFSGMTENTIIVTKNSPDTDSNLWAAVWNEQDWSNIKLARLQANSELWFAKILMRLGVGIVNDEELVIYNPA